MKTIISMFMLLIAAMGFMFCSAAYGNDQIIYSQPSSVTSGPGAEISFDVYYNTSNNNSDLTGIGLHMHWDSEILEFQNLSQIYSPALFVQGEPENNSENLDGDYRTDLLVHLSWLDIDGQWPPASLPVKLFRATFKMLGITDTKVNFSASSSPAGYSIQHAPFLVHADESGSLQVNIDGPDQAQWKLTGTNIWRDSGDLAFNLLPGQHTVEFCIVPGWDTKANEIVNIEPGDTYLLEVAYNQNTTQYQVEVSFGAEGGTVTGGGTYLHNSWVTLMAIPDQGYVFSHWTDNGQVVKGAGASYSFRATTSRNLTAHFREVRGLPGVLMLLLDDEE